VDTHFTYLLVDLGCIIFPLLFSFVPAFQFYKMWNAFFPATGLTALFFIAWDALFTHLGVWSFNPNYTMAFRFLGLPLEEILFFICIPYACLFTYYCVRRYLTFSNTNKMLTYAGYVSVLVLVVVALMHYERLYTSVSFALLAIFLFVLLFRKAFYLSSFFLTFILILPFFFLSNGILTGSFIAEPVVLYNPGHNLGIRMFTIPFEDTFYGMLLLLMNVSLYEYFAKRMRP
jgi:lycopene cyclase domain-containing protein